MTKDKQNSGTGEGGGYAPSNFIRRAAVNDRRVPLTALAVFATVVMALATVSVWTSGCEDAVAVPTIEGGIQYELEENGTVMRISPNGDSATPGVLPNSSGYGTSMLLNVTKIIVVGDIQTINVNSFNSFSNLQVIDLSGSNVTTIGDTSFSLSIYLQTIVFPEDVEELHIGLRAFPWDLVDEGGKLIYYIDDSNQDYDPDEIIGYTFELGTQQYVRQPKEFTVTYELGEGAIGPTPETVSVAKGAEFELAGCEATKEGSVFVGWNCLGDTHPAGYRMTMGNENIVLTAVWEEQEAVYTVSFLLNGGKGSFPQMSCHPGDTITISSAEPTKDSCTFDGWYCGGARYSAGQTVTVNSNMTFTAQWKADGSSSTIVPIFPGDEQDAIEVVDSGHDGARDDGRTVLVIGILVAIIAILAVMSVSEKD